MKPSNITWYIHEEINGDYEFSRKRTYDVNGTFAPQDTMILKIQVWNNRAGEENVQDSINSRLSIFFKNYEDNYILNICKIKINNEIHDLNIDIDRGLFDLGTISGLSNNGSDLNTNNFREFELIVGPFHTNMKSELKGMIIDLENDN